MIKEKFDYIDVTRGVCMLLVVYGHILFFGYNENGSYMDATFIANVFNCIRMPMFFFISGFLSYSLTLNIPVLKRRVGNRIFKQLWPTLVLMVTYSFFVQYMNGEELSFRMLGKLVSSDLKGGYWFTISMVEIYLSFAILAFLIIHRGLSKKWYLYGFIFSMLFRFSFYVFSKNPVYNEYLSDLFNFLSLYKSIYYAPFFYMGVVWRVYNQKMGSLISHISRWWIPLICILYVIIVMYINERKLSSLEAVWGLVALPVAFGCVYSFRDQISSRNPICKMIIYVGKRTLPVYLFHYFFINILIRMGVFELLSPFGEIPIVGIAVMLILTGSVTWVCCILDYVIKNYIPWLHSMVFSPIERKQPKHISSLTNT